MESRMLVTEPGSWFQSLAVSSKESLIPSLVFLTKKDNEWGIVLLLGTWTFQQLLRGTDFHTDEINEHGWCLHKKTRTSLNKREEWLSQCWRDEQHKQKSANAQPLACPIYLQSDTVCRGETHSAKKMQMKRPAILACSAFGTKEISIYKVGSMYALHVMTIVVVKRYHCKKMHTYP